MSEEVYQPIDNVENIENVENVENVENFEHVNSCEVCHHHVKVVPSRTPSVKLHSTTPSLHPVEPTLNNSVSRIPSLIDSINSSINRLNTYKEPSVKVESRRPSKNNLDDVKIEIADQDHENLQNVDLNELVKSLNNNSNKTLEPIREEMFNSPTVSETEKSEFKIVKNRIIKDVVVPSYLKDVKCTVNSRGKWRNASNQAELVSKLLTGAATIIAFSAGAYTDYTFLSFIAGCVGTGAMVCQQFSTYAKGECKERTDQANKILKVLGIDSIPDLHDSDE
jgi:hypothetical protein